MINLSPADRDAIERQLKESEETQQQVWSATRTLEKIGFSLNVEITSAGYVLVLSKAGEPPRTMTALGKSEETLSGIRREFLEDLEGTLNGLVSDTFTEPGRDSPEVG
jgi:hypothetical protein